ncbi:MULTISPECIES: LysR family transcriptional regulator [Achromobacter]|uniref:Glycine cleavage system transcriptional activator n=1 Tax=Achromobacter animicus TaxID=1389935 RepID=A0A6S7AAS1_9BURK|nr:MULTISPECIES: LysR family transcriptional regulator [Achromobacter]MBV7501091.1 LysR family transcriptional regulator [Achromobacter sp. ACM05]CAB3662121.1 Glycine cleavage system transcriptional activator [Achromobacter animicus]CAB3823570.1 Glycine cleavage system transcriptional activator [Achromobacter animicus]
MTRHFDDLQLGSIEMFCLAAELSSFTAAANAAGVTPAAVSRSVSRLEARLGIRLFVRSTRHIRLSDEGRAYFEQVRPAIAQLVDAERQVGGQGAAGRLRISLPTPYAHYRVLPLLPAFRDKYPNVDVHVHISNRNVDFADDGYDLSVRGRAPDDSALIARKLEDAELVVVGAPEYLRRRGTPQTLEDLAAHDCIQFDRPSSGRRIPWTFQVEGEAVDIVTDGAYGTAEDVLGGVTLARAGAGLFQTYRFVVEDDLRAGRLTEVLQQHGGSTRPFVLLYPHARHISRRVRAFVDFLVDKLAD